MSAGDDRPLPALFATIHFRSARRPGGYTADQIAHLNRVANGRDRDEAPEEGDRHDQPEDR